MKIDWTKIGGEYNGTKELKTKLLAAHSRLTWLDLKDKPTMGMMQGMGIKSAIKNFHIPATHVSETSELAPYGLYGIRGKYENGTVDILIIDEGIAIVPVCMIHHT